MPDSPDYVEVDLGRLVDLHQRTAAIEARHNTALRFTRWMSGSLITVAVVFGSWLVHVDQNILRAAEKSAATQAQMLLELRILGSQIELGARFTGADGEIVIEAMLNRAEKSIDFSPRDLERLRELLAELRRRRSRLP